MCWRNYCSNYFQSHYFWSLWTYRGLKKKRLHLFNGHDIRLGSICWYLLLFYQFVERTYNHIFHISNIKTWMGKNFPPIWQCQVRCFIFFELIIWTQRMTNILHTYSKTDKINYDSMAGLHLRRGFLNESWQKS